MIQFVVTGSMHYVVHMQDVNYEIYSKKTPAIYWYEGEDLSFDIVLHPDCGYENYIVTLNDVELKQNPDLRMLLSASSKLNEDDIKYLIQLAERMNRE